MNSAMRRNTAILEIYILSCIAIYLIGKQITSNHIENIQSNFKDHRQTPGAIITAGLYGKSSKSVFSGIIGQKVKVVFNLFLKFLSPILNIFYKMFASFQTSINRLRGILTPIREFIASAAKLFYDRIQKFTIGILYSTHKMRNSMKRSMSGFNLMMHSLEHSKNSLESIVKSKPVRTAVNVLGKAEWVSKKANKLMCFSDKTYIKIQHDNKTVLKRIGNINTGDILEDGGIVLAIHKFINLETIYKYDTVYVSGNHVVKENNKWITVSKSEIGKCTDIIPKFLYCLSTTSGEIIIDNYIFKDFNESTTSHVNFNINSNILNYLNSNKNGNIHASGVTYLDSGFHEDTLVEMDTVIHPMNNKLKKIKDIEIGDLLLDNNMVIGIVKINGELLEFYNDRSIIVTSNMKTNYNNTWYNIEKCPDTYMVEPYKVAYHLITSKEIIPVFNREYRDYMECYDEKVNHSIEELILMT